MGRENHTVVELDLRKNEHKDNTEHLNKIDVIVFNKHFFRKHLNVVGSLLSSIQHVMASLQIHSLHHPPLPTQPRQCQEINIQGNFIFGENRTLKKA
jgi:hypothetical protein